MTEPAVLHAIVPGGQGGADATLHLVRRLSVEETEQNQADAALLRVLGTGSHMAGMRLAEAGLFEALDVLEQAPTAWDAMDHLRDVQQAFRGWLSELRMFCDDTAHWISQNYGKDGREFAAFRGTLNAEHAANLAYRVCDAVRNVSLHVGEVINDAHVSDQESPDGEIARVVRLGLDCRRLLQDPSVRLPNPKTRTELESLEGSLDVEACVGTTSLSCRRALLMLADALRPELEASATRVLALEAEADNFHAQAAAALLGDFYAVQAVDLKALCVSTGGWDEARSALSMLQEVDRSNPEPHVYRFADLRLK